MSGIVKFILAANLIVLAILAFMYPHLMIAPGKLIPGHHKLETDCFACHAAFTGAKAERCITCHEPDKIGRLTSLGQPIQKPLAIIPFHQKLIRQDCIACHSDHAGVQSFRQAGQFNHTLLQAESRKQCQTCHKPPADSLHRQITGSCSQCHTEKKWVPATFDHDKYFQLDEDHNAACATCHVRNDYSRYTCYGCHEHSPDKIRREHLEEGIRDFKNCVECHRNADEDDIRMPGQRGHGEGGRRGREDDD